MTDVWSATAGVEGAVGVVLVHGSLDRSAGLLKLSRRLDHRFRVTRYDRRGYGRSRPHDGPFDMDAHVDDLFRVVEACAADRVVVFGHSYGGNVALALVDRHPGVVDGVISYESPHSWQPWWPTDSAGGDAVSWAHDPGEAAERFMRHLLGDERWGRLSSASRAARREEGVAMVAELTDLRRRPPWRAEAVTVPVLAQRGELARDHHRLGTEALAEALPDAAVDVVPGARHFGPNTHADAVAQRVTEFVERVT
ncbi:MAG: alpha/beta hydrolase [Ilumatobacter sp.]|uniref:alpha/beta fold hydrolase n=1 Tax=Ilumatobacter sp. TaxID=1967498 RepID=UPI0026354BFC|nr:alpha/beta hydrolase [Ilumatobacter sp.]MDJ0769918.1 alpha/beta hydrolase [Ilumatobacter sp.]